MRTIEIDGKKYQVDVKKAVKDGFLREIPDYPLKTGDVYSGPYGWVNQLLIKTEFNKESYSLIGLDGLNPFNGTPANVTLSEIQNYLVEKQYKFSHNINDKVWELIENPAAKVV